MKARDELTLRLKGVCAVRRDEPMSRYTSFRTGGPADFLLVPRETAAVPEIVRAVRETGMPLTVIGGGTNLLVGDRGIRGAVLMIREEDVPGKITLQEDGSIYADASVSKERFIGFALDRGFGGMEFMAGIPGCLGGGIIMNAGTYMGWFADIVKRLDIVDEEGRRSAVAVTPDMSSYRKLLIPAGAIVIGGRFALNPDANREETCRRIDDILADRKGKHPLDFPSAGSVFKNPDGHSSWQLVDKSGLKGYSIGGAKVSELHTNFIINAGGAASADILNLIEHVRSVVAGRYGVTLETEVRMIGEF